MSKWWSVRRPNETVMYVHVCNVFAAATRFIVKLSARLTPGFPISFCTKLAQCEPHTLFRSHLIAPAQLIVPLPLPYTQRWLMYQEKAVECFFPFFLKSFFPQNVGVTMVKFTPLNTRKRRFSVPVVRLDVPFSDPSAETASNTQHGTF